MKEDFLHYLWQYKLFDTTRLKTTSAHTIEIKSVGEQNTNTGPDFFNAQLRIGEQLWAGTVEIHVKASDWYVHGHENDVNYENVILHVVWEKDVPVFRKDNTELPTLQLSDFVKKDLLLNYKKLLSKQQKWINCEKDIHKVPAFTFQNWLERLYFERLEQKAAVIREMLDQSQYHWEAVLFQLLAKNFGLKVNGDAFFNMAKNLDFAMFRKESDAVEKLEALLLGQAGLLLDVKEDVYYKQLQKEYYYLATKHQLKTPNTLRVQFFRLRPTNFPTIRLAQLASLYATHQHLFSKLQEIKELADFYRLFHIKAAPYWDTHYHFEAASKRSAKKLTPSFIDLILINTVIPMRFVYQTYHGKLDEQDILGLITKIRPEKNRIISRFQELKVTADAAFETQALIQLKNNYCALHKCLHCSIGNYLLRCQS